jgi:uncharacterized protein YndB with AHSA1/START domain
MTPPTADLSVRKSITVDAPAERAFAVFTEGMSGWWPLDSHHIAPEPAVSTVLEPRAGGRWYERAAGGAECDWGTVRVWEPPHRVVLGWHLGPDWAYNPDPARATEVEVRFIPEGSGRTRVELEHRGFEVHGDRAEETRGAVDSPGGWTGLLERFAAAAGGR